MDHPDELSRGKANQANEILFTFSKLLQSLCDTCLKWVFPVGTKHWGKLSYGV